MTYFSLIALVFTIHMLAVMSPGPDFIMVIKNAIQYNRKTAVYTALGISLGIGVHIAYSITGVAYVLQKHENIYLTVKILGALYIIYIGVKSMLLKQSDITIKKQNNTRTLKAKEALKIGFITNVLNPKVSLFFLSLFTVIIPPDTPAWVLLSISIMVIVVTFLWFSLISYIFSTHKTIKLYNRYEKAISIFFGILLIGIGLGILTSINFNSLYSLSLHKNSQKMTANNPLLHSFDTAPFSQIKPEHFEPAIDYFIDLGEKEIAQITNNNTPANFSNTIEALAFSGMQLDRITSILSNLNSAETNKELQEVADKVMPKLTAFHNNISLNPELFERIKFVYEHQHEEKLNAEQIMLLQKTYKSFARNGANLNDKDKEKLRQIDQKLTKLKLDFSKNVLEETNAFQLQITDKNELSGLPEDLINAAAQVAKQSQKEGWIFTLHYPSYVPFMKYADNRDLRKKMALAYGSRAYKNNTFDNRENVLEIVRLRKQRANLLGYKTHADFVLEERMAKNPETVMQFLDNLYKPAYPAAKQEFQKLLALAQKDGISILEKWDISYYIEKLKKQELDLDEELTKPYFQLEKVTQGAFLIAQKLYGLQFEEINNIDKYHSDVKTYKVTDANGDFLAIFYTDFFPRKGKRQGAWMTSYKSQWKKDGVNSRPHISIVCNFTKATENKPVLLSFNEVTTLFHEFGHALHGMLANTTYPSLSGTSVYWDFVELPSQFMENYAYEKQALNLFAQHYKTQETIPDELINKIKKSMQFMEAYATVRQLSFGYLDMGWHYKENPENISDVGVFEEKMFQKTQLVPHQKTNNMSVAFSHIFPGGYSSGYYSYKWAEVLDADAFAYFQEKGIFNQEIAIKFRKLLSSGGTVHPMELYKEFRGHEPKTEALLKRAGLLN